MVDKQTASSKRRSPKGKNQPAEDLGVSAGQETAAPAQLTEVSMREKIALLAYSFWEARGGQGGSPEEDWYRAEQQIRAQYGFPKT